MKILNLFVTLTLLFSTTGYTQDKTYEELLRKYEQAYSKYYHLKEIEKYFIKNKKTSDDLIELIKIGTIAEKEVAAYALHSIIPKKREHHLFLAEVVREGEMINVAKQALEVLGLAKVKDPEIHRLMARSLKTEMEYAATYGLMKLGELVNPSDDEIIEAMIEGLEKRKKTIYAANLTSAFCKMKLNEKTLNYFYKRILKEDYEETGHLFRVIACRKNTKKEILYHALMLMKKNFWSGRTGAKLLENSKTKDKIIHLELAYIFNDKESNSRISALAAIQTLRGQNKEINDIIIKSVDDPDKLIRSSVISYFREGNILRSDLTKFILETSIYDDHFWIRSEAAQYLALILKKEPNNLKAIEGLKALAKDKYASVNRPALEALSN